MVWSYDVPAMLAATDSPTATGGVVVSVAQCISGAYPDLQIVSAQRMSYQVSHKPPGDQIICQGEAADYHPALAAAELQHRP